MASKSSQSTDSLSDAEGKAPSRPVAGGPAGRFIVNLRCFVGAYRKTYTSVVKPYHFPVIQIKIFGNILHFPDITLDRPMPEFIVRHWKEGVEFEIGLQFCLPLSGQILDLNLKVGSNTRNRYLEGKKVYHKNLDVVLKEMSPKEDEDNIIDFVKLLILYFFVCILFTNTNNLCPKGLVALVDDLPALGRYNWTEVVHQLIIDSLCSAAIKLQANSKRVGYVLGCTPLHLEKEAGRAPSVEPEAESGALVEPEAERGPSIEPGTERAHSAESEAELVAAAAAPEASAKPAMTTRTAKSVNVKIDKPPPPPPPPAESRKSKRRLARDSTTTKAATQAAKSGKPEPSIIESDFVNLTSHMAFVSSDVIDAYQHLLEEAEGQRCIYSTTFLYQTIGTAIGTEIFLNDLTKGVISDAKYWFIPLFDFDHLHLLAVDLQKRSTFTSRRLKTLNTTLGLKKR
uniref:Uncharacterized protein n=1 Tax=Ananas comosus var. bracteatus TaxID=296719 RepID=A0A6V7P4Q4_ANACO|nr:unnamed protein product [Ananas comosus var. bracteatus]